MPNSRTIPNMIAALAIVSAAAALTAGKAEAYACMGQYAMGSGIANSQGAATALAKAKWTSSVKGYLGLPWSVWNIAEGQSVTCKKVRARGGRGKTIYSCVAKAKPCKYVVN